MSFEELEKIYDSKFKDVPDYIYGGDDGRYSGGFNDEKNPSFIIYKTKEEYEKAEMKRRDKCHLKYILQEKEYRKLACGEVYHYKGRVKYNFDAHYWGGNETSDSEYITFLFPYDESYNKNIKCRFNSIDILFEDRVRYSDVLWELSWKIINKEIDPVDIEIEYLENGDYKIYYEGDLLEYHIKSKGNSNKFTKNPNFDPFEK